MNAVAEALLPGRAPDVGCAVEASLTEPVTEEDRRDLAAARTGDEAAFARLIGRYEHLVHAQMLRFSRDPVVCRELVQDVFVEVYYSLGSFRGQAPFLHWLRRVATRTGYRYWTREARTRRIQSAVEAEPAPRHAPPATPSDAAALLFEILAQLPAKDRLVLTLFYLDQCPAGEIAERAGWSETLVRVRLHRARNRLKKLIESTPAWRDAL